MAANTLTKGTLVAGRRKGTWRWQYVLNGKRDGKTFQAGGKREAWRYVDEVLRPQVLAEITPTGWTVARFLQEWLRLHPCKTPGTRERYSHAIERYFASLGAHNLQELTSRDVQAWVIDLLTEFQLGRGGEGRIGLSQNTVKQCLQILRMALRWGVRQEPPLLQRNVAELVAVPNVGHETMKREAFTWEEAATLIQHLEPPYGAVVALGLVGLRIGEALAIHRHRDLDFERRQIHVRQKAAKRKGIPKPVLEPPKGGKTRTVPMPEWIVPILKAQLEWSVSERNQSDLLTANHDAPVHAAYIGLYLRGLCHRTGVRPLSFHSLRHSFATVMRQAGMTDLDLAGILGHADTSMIQRLYGNHPDADERRNQRVARAMDTLMSATSGNEIARKMHTNA
jgi:integrase